VKAEPAEDSQIVLLDVLAVLDDVCWREIALPPAESND
jgi:hypothetical protein